LPDRSPKIEITKIKNARLGAQRQIRRCRAPPEVPIFGRRTPFFLCSRVPMFESLEIQAVSRVFATAQKTPENTEKTDFRKIGGSFAADGRRCR